MRRLERFRSSCRQSGPWPPHKPQILYLPLEHRAHGETRVIAKAQALGGYACTQGRREPANWQPTRTQSNSQGVSRSVLTNTEIGILRCIGGGTDTLRSQQSSCSVYDRSERRALLREIQCSLDSEAIAPLPNIDHDATRSTGESESAEPNTHTEEWLVQTRLRLAALKSAASKEAICPADDAKQVAFNAGQDVPNREPVRVPLSDQPSMAWCRIAAHFFLISS